MSTLSDIHDAIRVARGKRSKELRFALNRADRKLDRLGIGYTKYFTNIKFSEVLNYCRFEVHENDIFTVGGRVFRQKRGVAIGGTCSAQAAIVKLWSSEHNGYPALTPQALDPAGLHPGSLPVFGRYPFRYVDNLVGVKCMSTPLQSIVENFQHIYGPQLQPKAAGTKRKTLLAQLHVTQNLSPQMSMGTAQQYTHALPI